MGVVWRAVDTKLNRQVAIKILPEAFAHDADRMARFTREALVLASLNHPNIAAIYGLEKSGGVRALVMELVEGPTLADRIQSAAISWKEALHIARQIAEGLESAHERGVVHRDLKPGNVKVTPEGNVKVLDFGLAKTPESFLGVSSDPAASPTRTISATREGSILGAAAYMSPEQARGVSVDVRSDIWAFGAVLYEMLSGRPAFPGETASTLWRVFCGASQIGTLCRPRRRRQFASFWRVQWSAIANAACRLSARRALQSRTRSAAPMKPLRRRPPAVPPCHGSSPPPSWRSLRAPVGGDRCGRLRARR